MRYSEMSDKLRVQLLDDPENYPFRVSFLGKEGLLTMEELLFLRDNEVDFDISDNQIEAIMAELGEAPGPPRNALLRGLGAIIGALAVVTRIRRASREE
ncbi:MAG: hypothetical protein ACYC1C_04635 [Chloroflexota bacterium]